MEFYKTVSGTWNRQVDDSIKGVIDTSKTARAITGSETDQDYEFYATIKITSGKGTLIVNFSYGDDWKEWYLEIILDPTANKVTLDAVIRNADGTEYSRDTLNSRNMTLETATEYKVRVKSREIESGVFAVYGYIDDFMVVEAEDLESGFDKGMHGFEALGADTEYSEFSAIVFVLKPSTYGDWDSLKDRLGIKRTDYTQEQKLAGALEYAKGRIDSMFAAVDETVPSFVPQPVVDAATDFAVAYWYRESQPDKTTQFERHAIELITEYIENTYYKGSITTVRPKSTGTEA